MYLCNNISPRFELLRTFFFHIFFLAVFVIYRTRNDCYDKIRTLDTIFDPAFGGANGDRGAF